MGQKTSRMKVTAQVAVVGGPGTVDAIQVAYRGTSCCRRRWKQIASFTFPGSGWSYKDRAKVSSSNVAMVSLEELGKKDGETPVKVTCLAGKDAAFRAEITLSDLLRRLERTKQKNEAVLLFSLVSQVVGNKEPKAHAFTDLFCNGKPCGGHGAKPLGDSSGQEKVTKEEAGQEKDGQEKDGQEKDGQEKDGQEMAGQEKAGKKKDSQEKDGQKKSGQENASQEKAGQEKTGQEKDGQEKAGQDKTYQKKAGHEEAGHEEAGQKTGQENAGQEEETSVGTGDDGRNEQVSGGLSQETPLVTFGCSKKDEYPSGCEFQTEGGQVNDTDPISLEVDHIEFISCDDEYMAMEGDAYHDKEDTLKAVGEEVFLHGDWPPQQAKEKYVRRRKASKSSSVKAPRDYTSPGPMRGPMRGPRRGHRRGRLWDYVGECAGWLAIALIMYHAWQESFKYY